MDTAHLHSAILVTASGFNKKTGLRPYNQGNTMRLKILLATLALIGLNGQSRAQLVSSNDLYGLMISQSQVSISTSIGYITGVYDASLGVTHCAPDNTDLVQLVDLMLIELQNKPALRNLPAAVFTQAVFAKTWPCAKKTKGNV